MKGSLSMSEYQSPEDMRIQILESALRPFAQAYERIRYYGRHPEDSVELVAIDSETMYELLHDGEACDRGVKRQLTVGQLMGAYQAMGDKTYG